MVSKTRKSITLGHLYPDQMNVYGDNGNIITLRYRLEKRNIKVKYCKINSINDLKKQSVDILVGGGGQDSSQAKVASDLWRHAQELRAQCEDGLTCLMVCGMYQLFGNYFLTKDGDKISGARILDLYTEGSATRMTGNVKVHSDYGTIVGFENHSGNTYLSENQLALGTVSQGYGNNSSQQDKSEGACKNNVFGTYLHGPVLPKNPKFADELISRALNRKYGVNNLSSLDDGLEGKTAEHIKKLKY